MSSHTGVPIEAPPENHPIKRHRTRVYARRVRDSLTTRVSKLICAAFLGLLLVLGIVTFILWLSLRPHRPRFHVQSFSVPGLNQEVGFQNTPISFDVTDRNPNRNIGIYYDLMNASLYYRDQQIGLTPLLYPFYQPPKNTTYINGVFTGATLAVNDNVPAELALDRSKGSVTFRLELRSKIRFRFTMWDTKHHTLHVSCDVVVGIDGEILATSKNKRCSIYF